MTIRRIPEPCRQCGSAVYTVPSHSGWAKCSHCGLHHDYPVTPPEPPAMGRGTGFTMDDARAERAKWLRDHPKVADTWQGAASKREKWRRAGLQLALTFFAIAAILLLAKLGLVLPPELMLAVAFACIVVGAVAGIWIAAGELVALWRDKHRDR